MLLTRPVARTLSASAVHIPHFPKRVGDFVFFEETKSWVNLKNVTDVYAFSFFAYHGVCLRLGRRYIRLNQDYETKGLADLAARGVAEEISYERNDT
jgi:hypothetical protein